MYIHFSVLHWLPNRDQKCIIPLIINLDRTLYTAEVRHLIVSVVTALEGVVALVLSLIFCLLSRFFVHYSINCDRILNLKIALQSATSCYQLDVISTSNFCLLQIRIKLSTTICLIHCNFQTQNPI